MKEKQLTIFDRLARLLSVKSLVTVILTVVFAYPNAFSITKTSCLIILLFFGIFHTSINNLI